jgi:hypothetical protein
MENGEDGQLSMTAIQVVVVEHRQEPEFVNIRHFQVEEKHVEE